MTDRPDLSKYISDAILGTNPDLYNLEERIVVRYESEELIISTAWASDWKWYETAIFHPDYNDSAWIVVEQYDKNRDAAQKGHTRWIERMTTEPLPEVLKDVVAEAYGEEYGPFRRME